MEKRIAELIRKRFLKPSIVFLFFLYLFFLYSHIVFAETIVTTTPTVIIKSLDETSIISLIDQGIQKDGNEWSTRIGITNNLKELWLEATSIGQGTKSIDCVASSLQEAIFGSPSFLSFRFLPPRDKIIYTVKFDQKVETPFDVYASFGKGSATINILKILSKMPIRGFNILDNPLALIEMYSIARNIKAIDDAASALLVTRDIKDAAEKLSSLLSDEQQMKLLKGLVKKVLKPKSFEWRPLDEALDEVLEDSIRDFLKAKNIFELLKNLGEQIAFAFQTRGGSKDISMHFALKPSSTLLSSFELKGFVQPSPDAGGYRSWLGGPNKNHLGHDYNAPAVTPVKAIEDGTIVYANLNVEGFGGSEPSKPGPMMWIRHRLNNGKYFYALYGHIKPIKMDGNVKIGEVIGTIIPFYIGKDYCPHLHLGIWNSESNPPLTELGYGPIRNFTNPINFLPENSPYVGPTPPPPSACIASVGSDHWKGEYFNNKNLSGTPIMVRDDGTVDLNFSWPGSPSASCGIGSDNFSVRWTRTFYFDGGTYRFDVTGDDGVRFYVDNSLKLAKWFDQPAITHAVDVPLSAGNHTIKMEYYESGGQAVAKLSWQKIQAVTPPTPVQICPGGEEYTAQPHPKNPFTQNFKGYCTWYVADRWLHAGNNVLPSTGNAARWLDDAKTKFLTGSKPEKGSIVVFGSTDKNPAGHVAYVESVSGNEFSIAQMNAGKNIDRDLKTECFNKVTRDTLRIDQSSYKGMRILGFIYPQSVSPPPVCTDGAQFVVDVTIPDNSPMQPGQGFTKTWRLKNTGNCTWGSGYSLVFVGGSQMGAPGSVSVPPTPVNGTADISVPMTAPSSPGTHQGNWQMRNPKGQPFGPQIWVKINVASAPPPPPPPPACMDGAQFVADVTIPEGTQVQAGQSFTKSWRLRNSGTCSWGSGYSLVFVGGSQMGAPSSVSVPSVPQNGTADIGVQMVAPSTPGIHQGYWQMRNSKGQSFGPQIWVKVNVTSAPPPPPPPPPTCTDGVQFVADVTIPDNTPMQPGQGFTKTWRLRNTGNCPWGSGYSLVFVGGSQMGAPGSVSVLSTPINGTADISVPMVAPSSPGAYQGYWQMRNSKGQAFGPQIWVKINVASTPISNLPPNLPTNLSQFRSDGVTGIGVGATTNESTLVFKGGVNDPNNDTVKLQIELRRLDEYGGQFTGTPTQESSFVPSGSTATISVYGLVNGNYHWRARTIDSKGATSNWLSAGNNPDSAADFAVSVGVPPPPPPPSACVDSSQFVVDVTIPDNTQVQSGQSFTKSWRLRNSGTCSWGSGYSLAFVSGSQMGAPSSVSVPSVSPNATGDISVSMVAPSASGVHQGYWQMRNSKGQAFGPQIWVKVNVASVPPPPPPPPPTCTDGVQFVADVTIPDNTPMQPGQGFTKTWRLRNTGNCPWGSGYSLVFVGGSQMGAPGSVSVLSTPINGTADISVPMVAPSTPGNYQNNWQMRNQKGQPFGPQIWVKINVASAPPPPPPPPACMDGAQFVADVTIPEGTQVQAGQRFIKTWRLRNTVSCSWGSGYSLVFVGGSQMGAPSSVSVPSVSPNATGDISVPMVAPSSPGAYQGYWQMRNSKGQAFGPQIGVKIQVASVAPPPQVVSVRIDSYSPGDPNNPVRVRVGGSTTLSVKFTNTGNTPWRFIAGASVWDSNRKIVGDYSATLSVPLQPGQQTGVSWSHQVREAGDYWVQFGVWKAAPFVGENLLEKKPTPAQKLIVGVKK